MEPVPETVTEEEKQWGMLAHLLGLAGYLVGLGQYIAPLVVYFLYKDKSKFVAFHALQSLFFQLAVLVALSISGMLCFVLIGFILLPVVGLGALIYVIFAALKTYNGELFEYWLVGQWARTFVAGSAGPSEGE